MHALLLALPLLTAAQRMSPPTPPKGVQVNDIPAIGLGTARLGANASEVIASAIVNGYRHFDCAFMYGNQKEIGVGIKEGLKRTGLSRSDLWITSKLGNNRHGKEDYALNETLDQLQLDYLDLFLIHWPQSKGDNGPYDHVETWKAMEALVRPTRGTRFIGISNFSPSQLHEVLRVAKIPPKVHQFESHPYLQQAAWVAENLAANISVTAYGPLGNTNQIKNLGLANTDLTRAPPLLNDQTIAAIARERGCTPAQVVLKWNVLRGVAVHPKAARVDHMKENLAAYDCGLTQEDALKIGEISKRVEARFYETICKYGPTAGCSPKALAGRAP